ncbi:hypothetical protein NH340_JMT04543 [Sarcoptes scabiei]|nr:hypothetical protein NH340_JMT04543 [Sarcoptes scabiei]
MESSDNILERFNIESLTNELFEIIGLYFKNFPSNQSTKISYEAISRDPFEEKDDPMNSDQYEWANCNVECRRIINDNDVLDESNAELFEYFDEYFRNGCGCYRQCHRKFSKSIALKSRLDALENDRYCSEHINHQHLVLLGAMNGLVRDHLTPLISRSKTRRDGRRKSHTKFKFRGEDVCRGFFLYVYGSGEKRFKNVLKHFQHNAMESIKHNSIYTNRLNRLKIEKRRNDGLVFIQNYAKQNGLQLPGKFFAKKNQTKDLYLLPKQSNLTRRHIYDQYAMACDAIKSEPISYALWQELWNVHFPNIQTLDFQLNCCFQCRQFPRLLNELESESRKIIATQNHLDHLKQIDFEINFFKSSIQSSIENYIDYTRRQNFETKLKESFRSTLNSMHYTVSWFSTISLPNQPDEPKILFKNGLKVSFFSITIEPFRKFILYLIPEFISQDHENLINVVVSILDHFFFIYSFGENEILVHFADNQLDQLKNPYLLSYLKWRVLIGKNEKILISFLPQEHSHSWSELYMGLFMRKFRNLEVTSMERIKEIAEKFIRTDDSRNLILSPDQSDSVDVYLVGDEIETVFLPINDWSSKLVFAKNIQSKLLKSYNHFEISIEHPGILRCLKRPGAEESKSIAILSSEELLTYDETLPPIIVFKPLSDERIINLFNSVGHFFDEESRRKIFSRTMMMMVESDANSLENSLDNDVERESRRERRIKCSYCGDLGHRESVFRKVTCLKKKQDMMIQ